MACSKALMTASIAAAVLAACGASMGPARDSEAARQAEPPAVAPQPATPGSRNCPGGIFTPADGVTTDVRTDPALLRQRAVRVDFSRIEASAARLVLNLFEDVCLNAVRDPEAPPKPDMWTGGVEGVQNSRITIVTTGRTAIGTIVSPPRTFQIRLLRDDIHLINEVDPSKYPREK
jgi:hypothetical protein